MAKKRRKRKKFKIKSLFIILLFLSFCLGIVYLLTLIKVRTFFVRGNSYLSDEEVLKELKLSKNSSFILTNNFMEKNIVKNSELIKNVKLRRTLDFEMYVEIDEYKVLFYDSNENKTVIENGNKIDYKDLNVPILINKIENKEVYNSFVKRMNKVDDKLLNIISEISYAPNGIDKERFLFSMNDGNYVYVTTTKLSKINDYKSIIGSVDNRKGILYLDYGNYFVPKE